MKKLILILLYTLANLSSCGIDNESKTLRNSKVDRSRLVNIPAKYFTDFNNEECKEQMDSAKNDINNGKLVYKGNSGWHIVRYDDELEELLLSQGIEYIDNGPNCTLEQECYEYYMDSIISQKFGKEFIRDIEQRADSLFLSRWKTKAYQSWDIDKSPFYKEGDAEIYIEDRIKFPEKWDTIPMKFKRQFVTIDVHIDNNGKLAKWEFHEFYNLKESNEQFLPQIKKQINQIMKDMSEWEPGKLVGKDVNSIIWLDIDLDKES